MSQIHLEPQGFVSELLGGPLPWSWAQLASEFANLRPDLEGRYAVTKLNYPMGYKMEAASALATFAVIRATKPKVVVETGVANGESSYFILSALDLNGEGALVSLDVAQDVGRLVPDHLKPRWRLRVLKNPLAADFKRTVATIPTVDLFLHDSCHDYRWQSMEYDTMFERLSPGGFLLSDDIDWSYAFVDFVGRRRLRACALFDHRKVFGGARKESV